MSDTVNRTTIATLRPDPRNANKGTERGHAALEDSLRHLGAGRSILVDRNGVVIAGNKTLEGASAIGLDDLIIVQTDGTKLVAVQRTDLDLESDEIAMRLALADNRIADLNLEWDAEVLLALSEEHEHILDGLFNKAELDKLFATVRPGEEARPADADEDRAAELQEKWHTELGQLWRVPSKTVKGGVHRLLCADSTDPASLTRLLEGELADLLFIDPPYNVAIVGGDKNPLSPAYQSGNKIKNDSMSDADFDGFLLRAFDAADKALKAGGVFYVCAPGGRTETQFRNAIDKVWTLRQCIVWVKQQFVFGRQDYHWRHESILYGWKEGAEHYFIADHTQDTVWEIDRPMRSDKEHPTQKPVDLPMKAIVNSAQPGELVLDTFMGSGTTIAAAEACGRLGAGIELEPKYLAVTLERLQAAGLEPEMVDDTDA